RILPAAHSHSVAMAESAHPEGPRAVAMHARRSSRHAWQAVTPGLADAPGLHRRLLGIVASHLVETTPPLTGRLRVKARCFRFALLLRLPTIHSRMGRCFLVRRSDPLLLLVIVTRSSNVLFQLAPGVCATDPGSITGDRISKHRAVAGRRGAIQKVTRVNV